MPLPSRYLRSSQQISRFPKLHGKGERTAADIPAMLAGATTALPCPHRAFCTDHGGYGGYGVIITPDGGPLDLATFYRGLGQGTRCRRPGLAGATGRNRRIPRFVRRREKHATRST
jgi:hypothetical protein